jgi:quinol monooxygenase YgiN
MTAYNVVRMRVKPGQAEDYLAFHRERSLAEMEGMQRLTVVQTGDRDFCFIGEWDSMDALAAARPKMIAMLDTFRERLEDLGGGLGVTDPISGEAVLTRQR